MILIISLLFLVYSATAQIEFAGYVPDTEGVSETSGPIILSEVGDLYSFGDGSSGQLGLGPTSTMTSPHIIDHLPRKSIYMASVGYAHSVAVTEAGDIYTWGNNAFGQLGFRNISVDFTLPVQVHSLSGVRIVYVCAGYSHTLAITDAGAVYAWGSNLKGQLGLEGFAATYVPTIVPGLVGKNIVRVSCGYDFSLAVTDKGIVYSFGDNSVGQLGLGNNYPMVGPQQIVTLSDNVIQQAEAGWTHAIAVDEQGVTYGWGDNSVGQLGVGFKGEPVLEPQVIEKLREKSVYFVATGYFSTFALSNSGIVYGFGSNEHGQLGIYDRFDRDIPTAVPLLSMRNITHISSGGTHTIVATGNNKVYAFGSNTEGQLGTSNFENKFRPVSLEFEGKRIYEVLAGYQFSLILSESCGTIPTALPSRERDVDSQLLRSN